MPAERRFGMDHEHYDWSPLAKRGVLTWPEKARVALCVIVNLEHMEWDPPQGSYSAGAIPGGVWEAGPFPTTPGCPTGSTATGWGSSGCWTCWPSTG